MRIIIIDVLIGIITGVALGSIITFCVQGIMRKLREREFRKGYALGSDHEKKKTQGVFR